MQIFQRISAALPVAILLSLLSQPAAADEKLMMKAAVAHEYGGPEVLKFEDVPRPGPKEDEALVRVIASGVNPADPLTLSGKYAREFGTHLPLIDVAKLQSGQTILIHGASGGVGSFAVQIAKSHGARVIATASTANQDLLKQLGADLAIDYTKTRFEDVARDVDAVLDPVGKETLARSYGVVKK